MTELLVRYFHFMGIILLASMLVTQNLLIQKEIENKDLKRLLLVDGLYGLGAMITLVFGLLLWLAVGKPAGFYSGNPVFWCKLGIFIIVGLMSIYPTVFLMKNKNNNAPIVCLPPKVLLTKRLELVFLIVLPFLAVLMARGVGN